MQEHDVVETLIYTSSINQGKQHTFDLIWFTLCVLILIFINKAIDVSFYIQM